MYDLLGSGHRAINANLSAPAQQESGILFPSTSKLEYSLFFWYCIFEEAQQRAAVRHGCYRYHI